MLNILTAKMFPDRTEADKLLGSVDEACTLLTDYNSRLTTELQQRKLAAKMLRDYVAAQKTALAEAEEKLQVCMCG